MAQPGLLPVLARGLLLSASSAPGEMGGGMRLLRNTVRMPDAGGSFVQRCCAVLLALSLALVTASIARAQANHATVGVSASVVRPCRVSVAASETRVSADGRIPGAASISCRHGTAADVRFHSIAPAPPPGRAVHHPGPGAISPRSPRTLVAVPGTPAATDVSLSQTEATVVLAVNF